MRRSFKSFILRCERPGTKLINARRIFNMLTAGAKRNKRGDAGEGEGDYDNADLDDDEDDDLVRDEDDDDEDMVFFLKSALSRTPRTYANAVAAAAAGVQAAAARRARHVVLEAQAALRGLVRLEGAVYINIAIMKGSGRPPKLYPIKTNVSTTIAEIISDFKNKFSEYQSLKVTNVIFAGKSYSDRTATLPGLGDGHTLFFLGRKQKSRQKEGADKRSKSSRYRRNKSRKGADKRSKRKCNAFINPVCTYVRRGNLAEVAQLLDRGEDVNQRQSGITALMYAAARGRPAMVELLLAYGADVNQIQSQRGLILLDNWFPDNIGQTALMAASTRGHRAVVELLLDHKDIDMDIQDRNGMTALILAAGLGHQAVVELLLAYGADFNIKTISGLRFFFGDPVPGPAVGYTALEAAEAAGEVDCIRLIEQAIIQFRKKKPESATKR